MPIYHDCQRCTACCRWPGQVRLAADDVGGLTTFLQMTVHEFTERFTALREDRRGLVLTENANGACVFLEGANCAVQPAKPRQCREFPNRWNFPAWDQVCRAVPCEVSGPEFCVPTRSHHANPII